MLDKGLVVAKIQWLNDREALPENKTWRVDDNMSMFAITGFEKSAGGVSFNPNRGVPVVVFGNAKTGEIKIYDARHFGLKLD